MGVVVGCDLQRLQKLVILRGPFDLACGLEAKLARGLIQKYPEIVVAFTGAPDEAASARGLVEQVGSSRAVSLAAFARA